MLLWVSAACALLVAAAPESGYPTMSSASAKGKSKKPKTSAAAADMARRLEEQGQGVMRCAVTHALDKGAKQVDVEAKVTINNRGQVIDVKTKVVVDRVDNPAVRGCVDELIRAIKFPASDAPLTTLIRDWSIQ